MRYLTALLCIVLAMGVAVSAPQERLENYKGKTILVFSPHPDDDTLSAYVPGRYSRRGEVDIRPQVRNWPCSWSLA